jgi:hypothetical protein
MAPGQLFQLAEVMVSRQATKDGALDGFEGLLVYLDLLLAQVWKCGGVDSTLRSKGVGIWCVDGWFFFTWTCFWYGVDGVGLHLGWGFGVVGVWMASLGSRLRFKSAAHTRAGQAARCPGGRGRPPGIGRVDGGRALAPALCAADGDRRQRGRVADPAGAAAGVCLIRSITRPIISGTFHPRSTTLYLSRSITFPAP